MHLIDKHITGAEMKYKVHTIAYVEPSGVSEQRELDRAVEARMNKIHAEGFTEIEMHWLKVETTGEILGSLETQSKVVLVGSRPEVALHTVEDD